MTVAIACNLLVEKKIFMHLRVNLFCRTPVIYGREKSTSMIYCSIHEMLVNIAIYPIVCYLEVYHEWYISSFLR